ncbi:TetR/AcrR family transcriptional regulator [Caproicibacterium sp. BJN0003]|uniref:TetR/AcrR family transcriptional regulator n=1 Tax=Caproicibacterium sp. BJN0003 TaxID=2994078 RepID=UPI00224C9CED|nr:TetR/AcrR family transcriptional regulator [Caproicibacterium sp. BJN0003]UZT83238.1 TetR/AcrR family transcriptional regulator [Caproicibacterium sp. BJN0003]
MGYNDRKRQEKEIKRKDIINAAERVFFSRGFENASMDEVAKEAEFSKRTVYLYFNSKEQIYFEIMIRGYRLMIQMIENSFQTKPPRNALEELRNIFFTFFEFSRDYPEYFKAIMEYETKDSNDQLSVKDESKAECYRLGEMIFGYLFRALQKGVAEGTLRSGLDTEQAALILWACTIGVYNTGKKKGDYIKNYHGVDPNEFISESFQLIMRLIDRNGENKNEKGV